MDKSLSPDNPDARMKGAEWPADGLEYIGACPVCNNSQRTVLHHGLVDDVFFCAPGKWDMWRCSVCESAYLDPRPSEESMHLAYANYYTHLESSPKEEYSTLTAFRKLRRRLVNGYSNWQYGSQDLPANRFGVMAALIFPWLKRKLDRQYRHLPKLPSGGGYLLDVGCGDGSFLELARNCGWNVAGIDFDQGAVANAAKRGLKVNHGGIEFHEGKNDLFDVITLSHVIEHVQDPCGVLKSCQRLLKPGGQLWLETPNIDSLGHGRFQKFWRGLESPRHLVLFNRISLRNAMLSADFSQIVAHKTPSACAVMFQASTNMENQRSPYEMINASRVGRMKIMKAKLLELIFPARSEFITVSARKLKSCS